jgi:hypothetical protein
MCDVAIAAAQTLTIDDLALIDEADLPSPTGGRRLLRRRRVRAAEPLTGARATNVS